MISNGIKVELTRIFEGKKEYFVPSPIVDNSIPRKTDEVFFNPHQKINRDISVLLLRVFSKINKNISIRICEPFGGVGVRTCRYVVEVPTKSVHFNDVDSDAVKVAHKNFSTLSSKDQNKIIIHNKEFTDFLNSLYQDNPIMDFVDIDPYGSPIPFVSKSLKFVTIHGLLAFTATDLASLSGLYPRALYAKYGIGIFETRIGNVHELAARNLVTGIQRIGLTQNQSLLPVFTLYYRHFIRTFMIRERGVDRVLDSTGFLHKCQKCNTIFHTSLKSKKIQCISCKSFNFWSIGPLYLGKLHNEMYLSYLNKESHLTEMVGAKKIKSIISLISEENILDIPWSFDVQNIAKEISKPIPPMNLIIDCLNERGYECYKTHFSGSCLKTNANFYDLCEIVKTAI
jgi:tRNA (guanine26-N2/guanine27-N2)-dimethyltransferase